MDQFHPLKLFIEEILSLLFYLPSVAIIDPVCTKSSLENLVIDNLNSLWEHPVSFLLCEGGYANMFWVPCIIFHRLQSCCVRIGNNMFFLHSFKCHQELDMLIWVGGLQMGDLWGLQMVEATSNRRLERPKAFACKKLSKKVRIFASMAKLWLAYIENSLIIIPKWSLSNSLIPNSPSYPKNPINN